MDFLGNLLKSENPLIPPVSEFLLSYLSQGWRDFRILTVLGRHFCSTEAICQRVPLAAYGSLVWAEYCPLWAGTGLSELAVPPCGGNVPLSLGEQTGDTALRAECGGPLLILSLGFLTTAPPNPPGQTFSSVIQDEVSALPCTLSATLPVSYELTYAVPSLLTPLWFLVNLFPVGRLGY